MSPQTAYTQDFAQALAGMRVNADPGHVISRTAQEVTPFGVVVGSVSGVPDQCRPPIANTCAILDDTGAYTSGTYVVDICGVTVSVVYNTNKATTLADVATAIQALGFITTAVYAANTITITAAANVNLTVGAVTGPVGGMTITSYTYGMTDSVLGVSVRDTIEAGSSRVEVNDRAVLTLANDVLNAGDIINGTINGVAIAAVTYATSEAVTLQLIANAIKTIDGVLDAVIDTVLRTITTTMNPGYPLISATLVVTDAVLAAVAPVFTAVYSAQGVSIGRNVAEFVPTEVIPVARKGEIWVQCEQAMTPASTVFVRIAATATFGVRGRLRTTIDSGTAVAAAALVVTANSITDPSGQLIVPVEINLP